MCAVFTLGEKSRHSSGKVQGQKQCEAATAENVCNSKAGELGREILALLCAATDFNKARIPRAFGGCRRGARPCSQAAAMALGETQHGKAQLGVRALGYARVGSVPLVTYSKAGVSKTTRAYKGCQNERKLG